MSYFPAREAQTGIACPQCGEKLLIKRTCHKVYMYCGHCHKAYSLAEFIKKADEPMEAFLDNLYCDRI